MRHLFSYLLVLLILGAVSCKEKEGDIPNPNPDPEFEVPTIIPTGEEKYLTLNSGYVFDQTKLSTFELKLPSASLATINANPAAEQYVEGMLIFEGDTISPVGIRYKGSVGGFVGCVSGSDWSNPSGFKTCTKLSMKVKINWEGREEKFFKLKKLQFHSQNLDPSKMHERLGYWLFREMGVPAPRSVHARLIINDQYSGLYALTEQIDGRFAKYNYDDDDGNLYKEIWPLTMKGVPYSRQAYINALKTNEDENPTVDLIQNFAQSISNATTEDVPTIIDQYMDINEIVSYAVVDRMIRNDDGAFHWYCGGSSCTNHNYYWYEEPNEQQMHLIPWDLDNAFENIISNENPVTPIGNSWGEITNNCLPFNYGSFNYRQWSASCDKLTGGWASFSNEYADLKTQFKNGPFSQAKTEELLTAWSNQIRDAVEEEDKTHDDAVSVSTWENELQQLKNQLEYARNH